MRPPPPRHIIQSYYAATSYTDLLLGRLLSVAARLFPHTVVAFMGDHGEGECGTE